MRPFDLARLIRDELWFLSFVRKRGHRGGNLGRSALQAREGTNASRAPGMGCRVSRPSKGEAVTTENPAAARGRGLEQWAGLGAVAYVVLFIVGAILAFGGQPNGDADPATVQAYFADSGHRDRISVGWILIVLGLFFFLWFLSSLRQTLRRLDGDGFLATLATIGGTIYAALALAAISVDMAIRTMSDDTFQDTVYPDLIHAAGDLGYVLHSSGGVGAGSMMIAASLAALRARAVPTWAGWAGVVAGVLALGSIFFFPQFLIAVWLLVVGVLLFRTTPGPALQDAQSAPR